MKWSPKLAIPERGKLSALAIEVPSLFDVEASLRSTTRPEVLRLLCFRLH